MDMEGLAEATLREFKRLQCSKYPVCEALMLKNRWVSAERNQQELEESGNRVMEGHGDRLSADGNRGLGAKLAEYRLQVMSCNWKRGPPSGQVDQEQVPDKDAAGQAGGLERYGMHYQY